MTKKGAVKRVNLCPACGACPEVALHLEKNEVHIGEAGNFVRLNKEAWNNLVGKIQSGELKKV